MNEDELTNNLVEKFDVSCSEAERITSKVSEFVQIKEDSELTEKMKDPEYIPDVLQNNTSPNIPLMSRWNQWIAHFTKDDSYQIG